MNTPAQAELGRCTLWSSGDQKRLAKLNPGIKKRDDRRVQSHPLIRKERE
jgi:hypothetical protein